MLYVELLLDGDLPFMKTAPAQALALVLFCRRFLFERDDVCHVSSISFSGPVDLMFTITFQVIIDL